MTSFNAENILMRQVISYYESQEPPRVKSEDSNGRVPTPPSREPEGWEGSGLFRGREELSRHVEQQVRGLGKRGGSHISRTPSRTIQKLSGALRHAAADLQPWVGLPDR